MKKVFIGVIILISIITPVVSFSWTNICDAAKDMVNKTDIEQDKFYRDKIAGRLLEAEGQVRNVTKSGSRYDVTIDCGNFVVAVFRVQSSMKLEKLQIGDYTKYSGKCISFDRARFIDTHESYLLFKLFE